MQIYMAYTSPKECRHQISSNAVFNASYFPSTWYDGSAMDDDKYIALSHIMLSFLVSYDEVGSMHGCNSSVNM